MKQDAGITEMVAFLLVCTLIITLIAICTVIYLPLYLEDTQRTQNEEALSAFVDLTNDITTLCLAGEEGLHRKNTLPESRLHQKARVSLIYGEFVEDTETGSTYRTIIILYDVENTIREDLKLSISSKGILKNTEILAPGLFLVTDPEDTEEQTESDSGEFVIEYTYHGSFRQNGETYSILSVRLL